MKRLLILLALVVPIIGLSGCAPGTVVPVVGLAGLDVAAFHRTLPDMAYSAITGKDCSVVRLDRGETYCRQPDPPLAPQPYCTRSLGTIDCWADPAGDPNRAPQVAQGPATLTPTQEFYRTAPWPTALHTPP